MQELNAKNINPQKLQNFVIKHVNSKENLTGQNIVDILDEVPTNPSYVNLASIGLKNSKRLKSKLALAEMDTNSLSTEQLKTVIKSLQLSKDNPDLKTANIEALNQKLFSGFDSTHFPEINLFCKMSEKNEVITCLSFYPVFFCLLGSTTAVYYLWSTKIVTNVGSFKLFLKGAVESISKKDPVFKLYKTMYIYDMKNIIINHKYTVFTGTAATVASISYVYYGGDFVNLFYQVKTTYLNFIDKKYALHPSIKEPMNEVKDIVIPGIHHVARTVSQLTWAVYDGFSYELTSRLLKLKDFIIDLKSSKK